MRLRRAMAAAAALAAASLAMPARAQYFEGRGTITGAGTYNSILTDAQYPTTLTQSGPSFTVSPALSLVYETPRTLNTFTYGFGVNLFLTKSFEVGPGSVSYNNRVSYQGRYQISELTALSLTASLMHTPVNQIAPGTDASQTVIDAIPAGAAYMLGFNVQQGLTKQFSPELSFTETLGATYNSPYNPLLVQPSTLGIQSSFHLQRQYTKDNLGVQLAVQASYFTVGEGGGGVVIPARLQLSNTLSGTWDRTINDKFTTALVLGLTQVVSPGLETPTAVQPTGSATLNYRLEPAVATLTYSHQGAPNLSTGAVNFMDMGMLRFSMPIGETGLTASGTGGFTHMTPIGQSNVAETNVFMGDASLTWRPTSVPSLNLGLRAQIQRQTGGLDPNAAFTRISTSLNITYAYPSGANGLATPDLPPTLGFAQPTGGNPIAPIEAPLEIPPPAAPAPEAPPKP